MIPGSFPIAGLRPRYAANAVHYDGSSYLRTTSALTGAVGGKQGILNVWLKPTGAAPPIFIIGSNLSVQLVINSIANHVQLWLRTSGGTAVCLIESTVSLTTPATSWYSIVAAWDTSISVANMAINGVLASTSSMNTNTIGWNATGCAVSAFADDPANAKYVGDMSELFVDQRYLDISVAANLAKFISPTTSKPVFLGLNGELIFGTPPLVYLPNPAATVNVNQGSGGNFIASGTITNASSSPSD